MDVRSVSVRLSIREFASESTRKLRGEATARQQGVHLLSSSVWIGNASQGCGASIQATPSPGFIRRWHPIISLTYGVASGFEGPRDRFGVDALLPQLRLEGALASWARAIARFNPLSSEFLVVEDAEVSQTVQRRTHQVVPVSHRRESPSDFGHRPGPRLQEPECGVQDDRRVFDRPPPRAPIREGLAPSCRVTRPRKCPRRARAPRRRAPGSAPQSCWQLPGSPGGIPSMPPCPDRGGFPRR